MATLHDFGSNVAGLRQALRQLPKEAAAELRDASQEIAADVAGEARTRAARVGRSYGLIAHTITATRDRIPVVKIGGSSRLPGRTGPRQTVGDLLWGSEFGGGARPTTRQFLPHLGTLGYALWPTVRARSGETQAAYSEALQAALERI